MRRNLGLRVLQAAICLICAILEWYYSSPLEGTEFAGGRVTRPLLNMTDVGIVLFSVAAALAFRWLRLSAIPSLMAALLTFPLYIYFVSPRIFRSIVGGEYSVPAQADFVWAPQPILGMIALALSIIVSLYFLFTSHRNKQTP